MGTTRQSLLDAAAVTFAEYGYQGATLARVGEHLGLTKSAVLYHFESKDQLLDEMLEPVVRSTEALIATWPQPPETNDAQIALMRQMMSQCLDHGPACLTLQADRNLWQHGRSAQQMLANYQRVVELLSGPTPSPEACTRAAAAVSIAFRAVTVGVDGSGGLSDIDSPAGQLALSICGGILRG